MTTTVLPDGEIEVVVTATPIDEPPPPPPPMGKVEDVALVVGGRALSPWQEVRITRGVERMPADFDLTTTEASDDPAVLDVQPGAECRLEILGDLVLTGFVDRYAPSFDQGAHDVRITGRSRSADLVDSSAIFEDEAGKELPTQLSAVSALELATRLARPHKVAVTALFGEGPRIPQFSANLTETPAELIERVARFAQRLVYDQPDGSIVLAPVGTRSHASGFQQGINVERASVVYAMDQRFGEYDVLLLPVNNLGDATLAAQGNAGWNLRHRVKDEGVPSTRRRRRVIMVEQMWGGEALAKARAEWEAARRFGRSQVVNLTTDSWRDRAGVLWEPNQLVRLDLPALKLVGQDWIISEVTYRRGMDGTHADLVLMPPAALTPQPTILVPFNGQIAEALR